MAAIPVTPCLLKVSEPRNGAPPKLNTPPSTPTSQYPPPDRALMPVIGATRCSPPSDPAKCASPKAKTLPSAATRKYPAEEGATAMPTIGAFRWSGPFRTDRPEPEYLAW